MRDYIKVFVSGSAGFIGSALSLKLLEKGFNVIGIDNLNDYYDISLKKARLARHLKYSDYVHLNIDLSDRRSIEKAFSKYKPQLVAHLAAQAGVRFSIEKPYAYVDSNLVGFANVLEGCRHNEINHLVYASSSSVYGANSCIPFSVNDNVDHPLSLYAASKKSNELMAHTYSNLFNLPCTGIRFFTVYGPWGRPDMALSKFTKAILENKPIQVFNYGKHRRDFTYIDDVVDALIRVLKKPPLPNPKWIKNNPNPSSSMAPWKIYNVGSSRPVELMKYIELLEKALHREAKKEFLPLQPGDVNDTHANIEETRKDFEFNPSTTLDEGINKFVSWYLKYYNK